MESGHESLFDQRVQPLAAAMATPATPLDVMALAVSRVLQPSLDTARPLNTLDALAERCAGADRDQVVERLFGSGMFRGDERSYRHWRNSCIDQVLVRGKGMPITLAIVTIAVGRRLGLPLVGVGMPGHFLVGDTSDPHWFADPFHAATGLDRDDCRGLSAANAAHWSDHLLDPTPDRLVIARVLNNLRHTFEADRDPVRLALIMLARQTMPEFASELRAAEVATAVFN